VDDWTRVLGKGRLESDSNRLKALIAEALSRFPKGVQPLRSVSRIQLRKRGRMKELVGLTTYCCVELEDNSKRQSAQKADATQIITFYSELLDQLSDSAAIGVIAHELAHAWLNEYVSPEASEKREGEADDLARRWGYGRYLDALEAESEPV
jgi:hypothetical protein